MLTALLIVHAIWVVWMILGIALTATAHWKPRLWRMPVFRTTHLLALLGTATVPLWSGGVCPITGWEWAADQNASGVMEPLLVRSIRAMIYVDVPAWILSVISAVAALYCVVAYILHPPWRVPAR